MTPESIKLLYDMKLSGEAVQTFVQDKSESEYLTNLLLRSAVERQLFILGEAMTQLLHLDGEACSLIPDHRKIIGFRNLLAHGYSAVDDRRVWDVVKNGLPETLGTIEALLKEE